MKPVTLRASPLQQLLELTKLHQLCFTLLNVCCEKGLTSFGFTPHFCHVCKDTQSEGGGEKERERERDQQTDSQWF